MSHSDTPFPSAASRGGLSEWWDFWRILGEGATALGTIANHISVKVHI
jgi:hypothetical protein